MNYCRKKIGCPISHISNLYQIVEFIQYFDRRSPRIIDIIGPLHLKGLSISEIQNQTDIPRSTIHGVLKKNRHILNPPKKVPFERWRRGNPGTRRQPPYGFGWLDGELIKDPKEYGVVQLIQRLGKEGRAVGEIVRYLNDKGYRSRLKRDWGYGVVKGILKRLNK